MFSVVNINIAKRFYNYNRDPYRQNFRIVGIVAPTQNLVFGGLSRKPPVLNMIFWSPYFYSAFRVSKEGPQMITWKVTLMDK